MKYTIRRTALALAIGASFFGGMLAGSDTDATTPPAPVSHTTTPSPTRTAPKAPEWANMLPESLRTPCEYEDSVNCYWDAGSAGNGEGHSFVTRLLPGKAGMVCVYYIDKADAAKWDYCETGAGHS